MPVQVRPSKGYVAPEPKERPEVLNLPGLLRLVPERECTVRGIGRCRYKTARLADDGTPEWVTVIDPKTGASRSVVAERITKVHSTVKLRSE